MPQFDFSTIPSQIFWLVIAFALMYVLVGRLSFPKIERVVEARAEKIDRDLAEAEELRKQADQAMQSYRAALKSAHDQSVAATTQALSAAQEDAAKRLKEEDARIAVRINEAVARIERVRAEAVTHLKEIATDVTADLVEKLVGQRPDANAVATKVADAAAREAATRKAA
ncbi:F0F1 ATP synthase subunit B' [Roseiterribacter gracilis]|uniref:ATP synthase subunit b n=1 Tax=Roseiterribacter gracilis TaxID=2812848 RepID=A0A8S8XBZ6_9PROT|nr:ATP synthase subunit b 2 [Rhodospirillales bacterium TMPK1]